MFSPIAAPRTDTRRTSTTISRLGQRFELFDQQSVQRLRPVRRAVAIRASGYGANGGAGIDDEDARRFAMHVLVRHGGRIGGEFADDLLEDVLERDETLDVAVFVDHEREAAAIALER